MRGLKLSKAINGWVVETPWGEYYITDTMEGALIFIRKFMEEHYPELLDTKKGQI